jgi:hypothetical protein
MLLVMPLLDDKNISPFYLLTDAAMRSTFIQAMTKHVNYLVLHKIWCLWGH